jgi:hypothetical protein
MGVVQGEHRAAERRARSGSRRCEERSEAELRNCNPTAWRSGACGIRIRSMGVVQGEHRAAERRARSGSRCCEERSEAELRNSTTTA